MSGTPPRPNDDERRAILSQKTKAKRAVFAGPGVSTPPPISVAPVPDPKGKTREPAPDQDPGSLHSSSAHVFCIFLPASDNDLLRAMQESLEMEWDSAGVTEEYMDMGMPG